MQVKIPSELIEVSANDKWLIDGLWLNNGVGILAAEPKCGKTWVAWELAVSVASGTQCLGKFDVSKSGRVLVFNAEDSETIQRERLNAVALGHGLDLNGLNVHILLADSLRLDIPDDVQKLRSVVASERPVLLILDCFVRLHRINENNSAKVAELLGYLRTIQKDFSCAIVLVHHSKKGTSKTARGGQKMRGSGELHAWGDSNLYLTKSRDETVLLDIEHRAAESVADLPLAFKHINGKTNLYIENSSPVPEVIEHVLTGGDTMRVNPIEFPILPPTFKPSDHDILIRLNSERPTTTIQLLRDTGTNVLQLSQSLYSLQKQNVIIKTKEGYLLK